ncbi:MAG: protein kinase [candidate division Zixibacteria bacterium]|nr:protein kinase [candidate division Zixibacteria bacterium]
MTLISGTMVSHYRIIEKIGAGGMGEVYLAEDTELNRKVALKFLPFHMCQDADCRARFKREAQAAAKLNHPNIVTIHEVSEFNGRPYIAMEYVEGRSLRDMIKSEKLSLIRVIDFAVQLCDGLNEAHESGIIHRDIKPANILVNADGHPKIADFGLASIQGLEHLTKAGSTLGTVAYMSPEQAQGNEVDARTDIWSFGIVLYEMITGHPPFTHDHEQAVIYSILHDEPRPLESAESSTIPELQRIVDYALKKDSKARYASASEMLEHLKALELRIRAPDTESLYHTSVLRRLRRPVVAIPGATVFLLLCALGIWFFRQEAKIKQARAELLPQIVELVEAGRDSYVEAYKLAMEARKCIAHDSLLDRLFSRITVRPSITTEPSGASVYLKEYKFPRNEWEYLGVTPITDVTLPVGFFRWKLEKGGYETVSLAEPTVNSPYAGASGFQPNNISRALDKKGTVPSGMVRVGGGNVTGIGQISDFFIDQYEVTNAQFKVFVDSGGYQKKEYWKHKFTKDGLELTWEEACREFVDQTGRLGPADWQAGDYPKGQGNFPVCGTSWYEAAAYAAFVGKSLPSVCHWGLASGESGLFMTRGLYTLMAPMSNFGGEIPVPVGSNPGITSWGVFDMAGNVREWCWNETPTGRIIRGGAWNDATYMFSNLSQAPPFDRSPKNGLRCVVYLDSLQIPQAAYQPTKAEDLGNPYKEQPVSATVFDVFKDQFSYDKTDLSARSERVNDSSSEWVQEKISFNAAYEHEQLSAYLFLPSRGSPPYQAVIYFPGSAAIYEVSSSSIDGNYELRDRLSFIVKSGRAVLWPIYKGTFERQDTILSGADDSSHLHTEWMIKMVKDFKRSVDYFDTRTDIDTSRLAYFGFSWGGVMGAIIPAVEKRLKASILAVGGLQGLGRPEVRGVNYVGRVTIPTLMLNGRYDMALPYETASKPMFDLLGTPKEQKELKLYETDHFIPRNEFIKETLGWLDRYLGLVGSH